jgi:FkbM family methyltransferase
MDNVTNINGYLDFLAALPQHHSPQNSLYPELKKTAHQDLQKIFGEFEKQELEIAEIGNIKVPYFKMGAVDSVNLFDLDELIIFSFYRCNKDKYRNVIDIGANIGVHSIILAKLGFQVTSYEPDPVHFAHLQSNIELNGVGTLVTPINVAVSDTSETRQFTRILGNTTGSHLTGAKDNLYGELEQFDVDVLDIKSILTNVDLIKLDAEGEEARILLATEKHEWNTTDAIVEVGNLQNAHLIFEHFQKIGVTLYTQKTNWSKVQTLSDMPVSYKEGSLFISTKLKMPWN